MRVAAAGSHERAIRAATLDDYPVFPTRVQFALMSQEEAKASSVLHITSDRLLDIAGRSHPEGILSRRLASVDRQHHCHTCIQDVYTCRGHFGDIEAPVGIMWIQPGMGKWLEKILNMFCHSCSRLLLCPHPSLEACMKKFKMFEATKNKVQRLCAAFDRTLTEPSLSRVRRFERLSLLSGAFYRTCLSCGAAQRRYRCVDHISRMEYTDAPPPKIKGEAKRKVKGKSHPLTAVDVLKLLKRFSDADLRRIGLLPEVSAPMHAIHNRLLVPGPSICRTARVGSQVMADQIPLEQLSLMRKWKDRDPSEPLTKAELQATQDIVDGFVVKAPKSAASFNNKRRAPVQSLEDRLNRKEGAIRSSLLSRV
jgi:DNA-directed RNA polymerase beta' subunit